MRDALSILALLAMLAACGAAFTRSVNKTIEMNDRANLIRCQNQDAGWADACRRVQEAQVNINTLGGHQ